MEALCGHAITGMVSMANNLRRGLSSEVISITCLLCKKEREMVNHLFVHCEFSSLVQSCFLEKCGLPWYIPRLMANLFKA